MKKSGLKGYWRACLYISPASFASKELALLTPGDSWSILTHAWHHANATLSPIYIKNYRRRFYIRCCSCRCSAKLLKIETHLYFTYLFFSCIACARGSANAFISYPTWTLLMLWGLLILVREATTRRQLYWERGGAACVLPHLGKPPQKLLSEHFTNYMSTAIQHSIKYFNEYVIILWVFPNTCTYAILR